MIDKLTWSEMFNYLIKQKNCTIKHQELNVPDLHYTLGLYKQMIEKHDPDKRANNLNCKMLKGSLKRIYNLHKQNKFKPITSK